MTMKLVPPCPSEPSSDTVVRRRWGTGRGTTPPRSPVIPMHPKRKYGKDADVEHDDDDLRSRSSRRASSSDDSSSSTSSSSEGSGSTVLLPSSPPREEEDVPTTSENYPSVVGTEKTVTPSTGGGRVVATLGVGTRLLRFLTCAVGINVCYLCYGVIHERTFVVVREAAAAMTATDEDGAEGEGRPITAFILVTQAATNALAAWAWMRIRRRWHRRRRSGGCEGVEAESDRTEEEAREERSPLNHGLLMLTALSYAMAMTCTNESMRYVSYPTAALCKSCKLVPTMIAGISVQRKNYPPRDWLGVICITVGIVVFNLSRASGGVSGGDREDTDSVLGLFLLFLSLVMDGTLGWCQGLLKRNYENDANNWPLNEKKRNEEGGGDDLRHHRPHRPPGPLETMMYTNLYAIAFFGPYAALTGQLRNGLALLLPPTTTPITATVATTTATWGIGSMICLLNLSAALGQFFIFTTIELFSPVVCTTLTTTRKFFTILLSIWKYDHVLTGVQWVGVALVFGGLYVQIVSRVLDGGCGVKEEEEGAGGADRASTGDVGGMETKKVR